MKTYICKECSKEFNSNQTRIFCSRSCYAIEDSRRKKEKYKTEPHHNLGRIMPAEEKLHRANKTAETWKDEKIRSVRINGINNYYHEKN